MCIFRVVKPNHFMLGLGFPTQIILKKVKIMLDFLIYSPYI